MQAIPDRLYLKGDPKIEVLLRRHSQAKQLSLRVSRLDGRVTLTIPRRVKLQDAARFLSERGDWVRGHIPLHSAAMPGIGDLVPVEGNLLPVRAAATRRGCSLTDGALMVAADRPVGPQIGALLKVLARDRLVAASDRYAQQIGRRYARVTLRDTRTRWGSCTSEGNLMYSWRLIMAPPEILDYVAAHEVAHLAEMNHAPAFWKVVERICPDYVQHRTWLRQRGAELHVYRFVG